jgi:FkbM family methyltransferase
MPIKQHILKLIPRRLELAARFNYNRALGRLDDELDMLEGIVRDRRRCIDVGANVGLYTYRFAQLFQVVESFEPITSCAAIIASSRLRNVRVHEVALSDHAGQAELSIPPAGGPEAMCLASLSNRFPNGESVSVPLQTLDSFEFTEVDLIKIDVEGHELAVLEGAQDTIRREGPTLLIEIEQRHHADRSIRDIFDFILLFGYRGSFSWNGRLVPLEEFDIGRHQKGPDPRSPDYANNFIFEPLAIP